ncbi:MULTISPECIES: LysR family transcriptional regulator [unclassified Roseitalea]|uniref:LysR family transcriptional regulator n=1 Tax=unclassified Roseitalea TaxID=2639107 RepID=UPI00273FBD89|nr:MULTISPECIES: LysR family transcriptional regulator [unclassified Roseitalea]
MRVLDMKTIVALARNRHFGRTATELNITQSAISSRLAAVEAELGCRLINRGEGQFELTPEGHRALASFERILGELDDLGGALAGAASPMADPLRIGAIDTVSSTWMPQLVDALHLRYPSLKIELTVDGTKRLVQGMKDNEFDLIFCLHPALDDGFRSYTACIMQMVWTGSPKLVDPDRVYSVAELAELPIITFPPHSPPYEMIAPYFHDDQALASKLTSCNSLYAIINLLIDGFGVGAIPTVTVKRELRSGLLHKIRVEKRFAPMPIIATYQANTRQDLMRELIAQARATVGEYCASVDPDTAWVA